MSASIRQLLDLDESGQRAALARLSNFNGPAAAQPQQQEQASSSNSSFSRQPSPGNSEEDAKVSTSASTKADSGSSGDEGTAGTDNAVLQQDWEKLRGEVQALKTQLATILTSNSQKGLRQPPCAPMMFDANAAAMYEANAAALNMVQQQELLAALGYPTYPAYPAFPCYPEMSMNNAVFEVPQYLPDYTANNAAYVTTPSAPAARKSGVNLAKSPAKPRQPVSAGLQPRLQPSQPQAVQPVAQNLAPQSKNNKFECGTLRTHLKALEHEDPRCVLIARRINQLGFESADLLGQHYRTAVGPVKGVLVAHSHVKSTSRRVHVRRRPSGLGFIIMQSAEDALRVIAAGERQTVNGVVIRIQHYQHKSMDELDKDFDEFDDSALGA